MKEPWGTLWSHQIPLHKGQMLHKFSAPRRARPRRALAQILTSVAAHDGTTDDAHAAAPGVAGREVQISAAGASSSTSSGTWERQQQVAEAADYASTMEALENRYGRLEQTVARNAHAVEDKFSQMLGMLSQVMAAQNNAGAASRDAAHAKAGSATSSLPRFLLANARSKVHNTRPLRTSKTTRRSA
eukprot:SAG11_NODE_26_length_23420_cov_40.459886_16_plen_187_part_00